MADFAISVKFTAVNQQIIEIGQFPLPGKIILEDYDMYSGDVLERYFKAELMESLRYRIKMVTLSVNHPLIQMIIYL